MARFLDAWLPEPGDYLAAKMERQYAGDPCIEVCEMTPDERWDWLNVLVTCGVCGGTGVYVVKDCFTGSPSKWYEAPCYHCHETGKITRRLSRDDDAWWDHPH